jgi:hypothetical protein
MSSRMVVLGCAIFCESDLRASVPFGVESELSVNEDEEQHDDGLVLFPPNSIVLEKGGKWSKTVLRPMAGTRSRATRASLHAVSPLAPLLHSPLG